MNQSIMPAMASCKTMYVEKEEISNEQEDTQISEIDDLMEKKCVPTLKVKGKKAIAKVLQKSYNKTVTPQNYNSTQKAFEAYKNGGTYKAIGISKVNITGVEGKKVGTIKLSNPPSPSGI